MNNDVNEFPDALINVTDLLEQECRICEKLLEMSRSKTELIVNGSIKELDKTINTEQRNVRLLEKLESKRGSMMLAIAQQNGIDIQDVTLSYLISIAEGALKDRLEKIYDSLGQNTVEQKYLNELNSKLINNNLEFINFSLNAISGAGPAGNTYDKVGQSPEKHLDTNLFDKKI